MSFRINHVDTNGCKLVDRTWLAVSLLDSNIIYHCGWKKSGFGVKKRGVPCRVVRSCI